MYGTWVNEPNIMEDSHTFLGITLNEIHNLFSTNSTILVHFSFLLLLCSFSKTLTFLQKCQTEQVHFIPLIILTKTNLINRVRKRPNYPFNFWIGHFLNPTAQLPNGITHLSELEMLQTLWRWKDGSK